MSIEIIFILCLVFIAILYSSVGHGGASGYLALMAIFGLAPEIMKSSALTLNLFVSAAAFYSFYKNGHFRWQVFIPLIIASLPMAFFGATIELNPKLYKILLGVCLIIAIGRMLVLRSVKIDTIKSPSLLLLLIIGSSIGFFSGMIGIGGGIILSPVLLLFRWADIKQTAGISALFIFLNSGAGIVGLTISGFYVTSGLHYWIFAVITGGIIGSFLGSFKFNSTSIKYILATVLLFAAFKLFVF